MPEHFSQKTRYTSMNYLVQGWNIYRFLLSPDELRQILSPYHLVIFNAHVPKDYVESTLNEYIAAYSSLYNLLISGEKIIRETTHCFYTEVPPQTCQTASMAASTSMRDSNIKALNSGNLLWAYPRLHYIFGSTMTKNCTVLPPALTVFILRIIWA